MKTHIKVQELFLSCRLWDNVEKCGTTRQDRGGNITRPTHCACWKIKATNTHSQYVILIAFTRQQRLHERASMIRYKYEGWNFNSGNYLFTNDTK